MANLKSIARKIKSSPKLLRETKKIVESKFNKEKEIFIEHFNAHPVTQEIEGGPDANNISGTLIGYGNLFSFIGFSENESPIHPVRNILRTMTRIKNIRKAAGNRIKLNININVPDLDDIAEASPMPWEPGRSWVSGIERGISGFAYYLNAARQSSRSGRGIQTDRRVRVMAFKNVKYMSELVRNFTKNLRNLK
tara:strand:+ start:3887 stop:4468 length:582 start_codon:yes stop_codon:yes gene_type:complete